MEVFVRDGSIPARPTSPQDDIDAILAAGRRRGRPGTRSRFHSGKPTWLRSDNKLIARFNRDSEDKSSRSWLTPSSRNDAVLKTLIIGCGYVGLPLALRLREQRATRSPPGSIPQAERRCVRGSSAFSESWSEAWPTPRSGTKLERGSIG